MNYSLILLCAGSGKRTGLKYNKIFYKINNQTVYEMNISHFLEDNRCKQIIVVTKENEIDDIRTLVNDSRIEYVFGGKERQDSVYNALKSLKNSSTDIVLIHDGARPFISERIINEGIKFAEIYGAAAPGVMPKDTIKVKNEKNFSVDTPNRANLVSIQTPQVFKFDEILECHEKIRYNGEKVTDDTMVVEKYGYSVYLYDGEYTNIKVTTPEDLILAERLI